MARASQCSTFNGRYSCQQHLVWPQISPCFNNIGSRQWYFSSIILWWYKFTELIWCNAFSPYSRRCIPKTCVVPALFHAKTYIRLVLVYELFCVSNDFIFIVPADTDVELPHFTLCKWVSSDDPEKISGEAKCKDDELSPNKPESPQDQHHGTSQKSNMLLFYVIFLIDAHKESKSLATIYYLVNRLEKNKVYVV